MKFEGFEFKLALIPGALSLLLMLFGEGEARRPVSDRAGEAPLTEGDDVLPMPPRAGEPPLAEGDTPRTNGFVALVEVEGGDDLELAINGRFVMVPVLCRRCGEEDTVKALVNTGWEAFAAPTDFAAEAVVARVTELDLVVDGEFERTEGLKRRGEVEDLTADDVDIGVEELFDEAILGVERFDEMVKAGRGLLEMPGLWGRGLLAVLGL